MPNHEETKRLRNSINQHKGTDMSPAHIYVGEQVLEALPGYYWARFANQTQQPKIIRVYHKTYVLTEFTKLCFDYPNEVLISHDREFPDDYQTLTLCGPILPPHF